MVLTPVIEKKLIAIDLMSIEYSGDKIGSELNITISIDSQTQTISKVLKHGTSVNLCISCLEGEITEGKTDFLVSVEAVEKDKISDYGSLSQNINVIFQSETIQEYTLKLPVIGKGGDKGRTGNLSLKLEAKLSKQISNFLESELDLPQVVQELAAVIYAEGRGESLFGQYLIATVIYNRARLTYLYPSNEGDFGIAFAGSRIRGIVRHRNQFDGYDNIDYRSYFAKKTIDPGRPFEPEAARKAELIAQAVLLINQDSIDQLSVLISGTRGFLPASRYVFFSAYSEGFEDAYKRVGLARYKYVTLPAKIGEHYFQSFKPGFDDASKRMYTSDDR